MRDLLLERIYQQVPDYVYEEILNLTGTPKGGKRYANAATKWFCKQYLNGKFPTFDEEMYSDGLELYFAYLKYHKKLKPIMDYETPEELENDIMKVINSGYQSKSDMDKLAREGSEQIYKSNNYLVLKINDYMACRKYGQNTRWCIATRLSPDTFESYNEEADIYFIIDRKNHEKKYACSGRVCWDEWDDVIFFVPKQNSDGTEENMDSFFTGYSADPSEFYMRVEESPELYDVLPKAFPQIPEKRVKEIEDKLIDFGKNPQKYIDKK